METHKIASYPEAGSTFKVGHERVHTFFQEVTKLNDQNSNEFVTVTFPRANLEKLIQVAAFRSQAITLRQDYCHLAIKNLLKKTAYLQLSLEFAENQITEEEFTSEIESNPEKYTIKINALEDPSHLHIMGRILENVGASFNTSQVSELFSVDISSINNGLAAIRE